MNVASKIIIGDADILVSRFFLGDGNHGKVEELAEKLMENAYILKFPNTTILEAVTALKRSLNQPELASLVNSKYQNGEFGVIYVDETIQKLASEIFAKEKSKKNTIFDCLVLATAKTIKAAGIFSFDSWYKKKYEGLFFT